jgi:VanZ like family/Concanavalin A-like lectin/glucanases superfamily
MSEMIFQEGKRFDFGQTIKATFLEILCAVVLCGILVAGLWPFHAPRNEVSWLSGRNGLLFGKHGTVVSASPFKRRASEDDNSCSLEMWLEPTRVDTGGMILTFYWPANGVAPFAARQYRGGGLVLERGSQSDLAKRAGIYVGDVFKSLKPVVVTITSGEAGVATYVDGILVKRFPNFAFSSRDLTGQLVVGNAASTSYNWSGQIKGLAVYDRELTPGEVSQHYADWTENRQTDFAKSEGIVALYLLNEGSGNVVHSQVAPAPDLLIPERFVVLNKWFLEPFWTEYRSGWSYWKDVGINVAGFIPLGFFFCSYFSLVRKIKHPFLVTLAVGFIVSLTIEVLQAFLPTRDSGMTDLITNTLGTSFGAMIYTNTVGQVVLGRAPLPTSQLTADVNGATEADGIREEAVHDSKHMLHFMRSL